MIGTLHHRSEIIIVDKNGERDISECFVMVGFGWQLPMLP